MKRFQFQMMAYLRKHSETPSGKVNLAQSVGGLMSQLRSTQINISCATECNKLPHMGVPYYE